MSNPYINVVKEFGDSFSLGTVESQLGMHTNFGVIMIISGNIMNVGSGTAESNSWLPYWDLCIASGAAFYGYDFPSGILARPTNRHLTNPNGNVFNVNTTSGHTVSSPSGPSSFAR